MIGEALCRLRPGAPWRLADEPKDANEYTTFLEWHGDTPAPTWDEIQTTLIIITQERIYTTAQRNRATAYTAEADPLFFKAQRGEATIEEWEAKVAEIRTRYPYPALEVTP